MFLAVGVRRVIQMVNGLFEKSIDKVGDKLLQIETSSASEADALASIGSPDPVDQDLHS